MQVLDKFGLGMYKERFVEEQIDGCLLLELDDDVLKEELGVSMKLHRLKLLAIIKGQLSVYKLN